MCLLCTHGYGTSHLSVIDLPATTLLKKDSPSLRCRQLVIAPQLDVGPPETPPYLSPMLEC